MSNREFVTLIWDFYEQNERSLPWRETRDPYLILVSEIMLQQTQVSRVIDKFNLWQDRFPTITSLAGASLSDVLSLWKGLGYNRRGMNLHNASKVVVSEFDGLLPKDREHLKSLPGVGEYTSGAVATFSWNIPHVFIETNIRSVFIHYYFNDATNVSDKELFPFIEDTLDYNNPREWYYALMDYGSYLKKTLPNPSRKSRHHTKQSAFKGSKREIRSQLLSYVLDNPSSSLRTITDNITSDKWNVKDTLKELAKEGFITEKNNLYTIKD